MIRIPRLLDDIDRSKLQMTNVLLPFLVGGRRVGFVTVRERLPAFSRGTLRLDIPADDPVYRVFTTVVELAEDVDVCDSSEYLAAWDEWQRGCKEILNLGICIGDDPGPVEDFGIESDWMIEWSTLTLDDMVG